MKIILIILIIIYKVIIVVILDYLALFQAFRALHTNLPF